MQAWVVALSALARRNVVVPFDSSTREYDSAPLWMALIASSSKRSFAALLGFNGWALINRALKSPVLDNSSLISRVAVAGSGIACGFSKWFCEIKISSFFFIFLIFWT